MSNVRWSIVVRDDVDRALRTYLGRHGMKKGDISQFVEEAVQARLFQLTVEGTKRRNQHHSQDEMLEAINEALRGK
ncbi:MAG: ribbon-helix-helix domain-containing protein [Pseudomonadales bacterium]